MLLLGLLFATAADAQLIPTRRNKGCNGPGCSQTPDKSLRQIKQQNEPKQGNWPSLGLDRVTLPTINGPLQRKNYDQFSCPRIRIPHKSLDRVSCPPKIQIRHKQFDRYTCQSKVNVKHKSFDEMPCYPRYEVEHQNFEQLTCYQMTVDHTPLRKYKVTCPAVTPEKTTLEEFSDDVKRFFRYKRKHCKINSVYSGLSVGQVVMTREYGKAFVADFVIRNKTLYFDRYQADSTQHEVQEKKVRAVRNLIVYTARGDKWRKANGQLDPKPVKLSRSETKRLMLKHLVQKNKLGWLLRMYPEERENLEALIAQYGTGDFFYQQPYSTRSYPFFH